jgi:hypothetical protein
MLMNKISLTLCCILAVSLGSVASAEPLKGGVKEEGSAGSTQNPIIDELQQQLNELRALNARLAKDAEAESGPKSTFPLKVEAVDPKFRTGKLFAEVNLPNEDTEDGWYRIPHWRAGKFHREKQIDHTISGDVETVSRVDHVYGMQTDKSGGIWHYSSWPRITKVETDKYFEYKIIDHYEIIEGKPNEFAARVRSTDIDVSKTTGKIARVTKQEEVSRYTPGPEGSAAGECEWQCYTAQGNPNTTVERTSVEEAQTEPFKRVDFWRKKDLKESFKRYLRSHGKADLIPDE